MCIKVSLIFSSSLHIAKTHGFDIIFEPVLSSLPIAFELRKMFWTARSLRSPRLPAYQLLRKSRQSQSCLLQSPERRRRKLPFFRRTDTVEGCQQMRTTFVGIRSRTSGPYIETVVPSTRHLVEAARPSKHIPHGSYHPVYYHARTHAYIHSFIHSFMNRYRSMK